MDMEDLSVTVQVQAEIENIYSWELEEKCYEGQYIDPDNKIQYMRYKPTEQSNWENFLAKVKDPKSGKWFSSGEGSGIPKGKIPPKRLVTSITRYQIDNQQFLLSQNRIIAYNQFGDTVTHNVSAPEKWQRTYFKWESRPNFEKGVAERVNVGVGGNEIVYSLAFNKENAEKLFKMRENDKIPFYVKSEERGKVYDLQPQLTIQDTFKLFVESSFEYLYNANYLTTEQKLLNMKSAEGAGLIAPQSDNDRLVAIKSQQALSQKDKMSSYR